MESLKTFLVETPFVRAVGRGVVHGSSRIIKFGFTFNIREETDDRWIIKDVVAHDCYRIKDRDLKGAIVIDGGANFGTFSVFASHLVEDSGRVVAVEPYPSSFNLLVRNISANSCNNVKPVNVALSNSKGTRELMIYERTGANSFFVVSDPSIRQKAKRKLTVRTSTIDAVTEDLRLDRVDLIKLDLEGAELEALNGAEKVISDHHPQITGELHPSVYSIDEVKKFLENRGYHFKNENSFFGMPMFWAS